MGAAFLEEGPTGFKEVWETVVSEGEGKVGDHEGGGFGAGHGSAVVDHHFEGNADGVVHAQDGVAEGVADEDEVGPALVGDTCRDGVVGGEAYDGAFAFECADGPGGSLHVFGIIG